MYCEVRVGVKKWKASLYLSVDFQHSCGWKKGSRCKAIWNDDYSGLQLISVVTGGRLWERQLVDKVRRGDAHIRLTPTLFKPTTIPARATFAGGVLKVTLERPLERPTPREIEAHKRANSKRPVIVINKVEGARKEISPRTRREHISVVHEFYKGRCPCCEDELILDGRGKEITGDNGKSVLVMDHYFARDQRTTDRVWPIGPKCDYQLTHGSDKGEFRDNRMHEFRVFQRRRVLLSNRSQAAE